MANQLVLQIIADANGLLGTLNAAQQSIEQFTKGAEAAGNSLGGGLNQALDAFTGLAKGGGIAAGVLAGALVATATAATAFAIEGGKQAQELQNLSVTLGLGTQKLQEYEVLLSRVGLGGDALASVFRTLSLKLDEARLGTGLAGDRFIQLGIDITKVTSTDDLLRKIFQSVSNLAAGTQTAAIAGQLLGRTGLALLPAMQSGAAGIDAAAEASRQLGVTLGGTQLQALLHVDEAVSDLGTSWTRFGQQLGAIVSPAVEMAVNALKNLLAWGSKSLQNLDSWLDTLAIRATHLVLKFGVLASMDWSGWFVAGDAWAKAAADLKLIDDEADKLIAKRKALDAMPAPVDSRPQPPPLVNSQQAMTDARALADAQLKFNQDLFKNETSLADARLQNFEAHLDAQKGYELDTDLAIAQARQAAQATMSTFTLTSIDKEIENYQIYFDEKDALYKNDAKSQAEKEKFEEEAAAHMLALLNQYQVAKIKADTTAVQGAKTTYDAMHKYVIQAYDDAVTAAKVLDEAQVALFHDEAGMLGASDAARRVRMSLIDAEEAKERELIDQTLGEVARKAQANAALAVDDDTRREHALEAEGRLQQALVNLDEQTNTKRRQALQQFPTFFELQMQQIVSSNVFSMSSMVSTWSGGIANMIVMGGNLKKVWQQTEVALVQAVLDAAVQQLAIQAIAASRQLALDAATAASKLAIQTSTNATIVAGETATAGASVAIWSGAATAILGFFSTIGEGFMALITETLVPAIIAVGDWIMGVLSAIAEAMMDSVFGIPIAIAIVAGIAGIVAALAATGNLPKLAEGGIALGPSIVGEAGPEAAIPLNDRGAAFMQDAFGLGQRTGDLTIVMQLDGREVTRKVLKYMPGIVYMKTGLA